MNGRILILSAALAAFSSFANAFDSAPDENMRAMVERYTADRQSIARSYPILTSTAASNRLRKLYTDALSQIDAANFNALSLEGRADYLLLRNEIRHELRQLDLNAQKVAETAPLLPFSPAIISLEESRRRMETIHSESAAGTLNDVKKQIEQAKTTVEHALKESKTPPDANQKVIAYRAAATVDTLRNTLKSWYGFYNNYDPVFTWWVSDPYKTADQSLQTYAVFLREKIVGIKPGDETTIVGNPIGREALMSDLAYEMIPYTPEELIAIANQEFAWCEKEMKRAASDLGYGDDWHKALEHVKTQHVEPGKQPDMIRDLAFEAIQFLEQNNLVTVPALAKEDWHMEMLSPEQQLQSPFFLGGVNILVSFPTSTMTQEQKLMSMRGNNIHFSRATVFHELIPGHHLQFYMSSRYRPYRNAIFGTPFSTEGWALYWEMLLWDMNFPKTPENRIGMLFWRMHRCARIIFSLNFHLGKMSPQECIDFLVDRVGHERDNAAAEVRRSFAGSYPPLYQCAYMLGGLQIRSLHKELVESGRMTNREFHDRFLQENRMPNEIMRAILTRQTLTRDFTPSWRFYGDPVIR